MSLFKKEEVFLYNMEEWVLVEEGSEEHFVKKAVLFGYSTLCLVYTKKPKKLYLSENILLRTYLKSHPSKDGYLELGTSLKQLSKKITHLILNEFDSENDFVHQRRSGINHVFMKQCKDQNTTLLLAYAPLQELSVEEQAKIIGRMKQNVMLAKKYGVTYELVSYANDCRYMRSTRDVAAFKRILEQH